MSDIQNPDTAPESGVTPAGGSREWGRNSNGDPELYDSDLEMAMRKHDLSRPEAEQLHSRVINGSEDPAAVAEDLHSQRVYYRSTYEQVPADSTVVPGVFGAQPTPETAPTPSEEDLQRLKDAATAPTTDPSQPEAGPYGPHADYRKVEKSPEEVAQSAGVSLTQAEEILDSDGTATDDDDVPPIG